MTTSPASFCDAQVGLPVGRFLRKSCVCSENRLAPLPGRGRHQTWCGQ